MESSNISIQENFLAEEEFVALRETLTRYEFPWYFSSTVTTFDDIDLLETPGLFSHLVYHTNAPCSPIYNTHFLPILKQLDCAVLTRIRINANPRLPKPYYSEFHSDTANCSNSAKEQWSVSILYINTNNGYTEFEHDGTKVESVANRLITFPSNLQHRGVTQTDTQRRIVVNFNYLSEIPYGWK